MLELLLFGYVIANMNGDWGRIKEVIGEQPQGTWQWLTSNYRKMMNTNLPGELVAFKNELKNTKCKDLISLGNIVELLMSDDSDDRTNGTQQIKNILEGLISKIAIYERIEVSTACTKISNLINEYHHTKGLTGSNMDQAVFSTLLDFSLIPWAVAKFFTNPESKILDSLRTYLQNRSRKIQGKRRPPVYNAIVNHLKTIQFSIKNSKNSGSMTKDQHETKILISNILERLYAVRCFEKDPSLLAYCHTVPVIDQVTQLSLSYRIIQLFQSRNDNESDSQNRNFTEMGDFPSNFDKLQNKASGQYTFYKQNKTKNIDTRLQLIQNLTHAILLLSNLYANSGKKPRLENALVLLKSKIKEFTSEENIPNISNTFKTNNKNTSVGKIQSSFRRVDIRTARSPLINSAFRHGHDEPQISMGHKIEDAELVDTIPVFENDLCRENNSLITKDLNFIASSLYGLCRETTTSTSSTPAPEDEITNAFRMYWLLGVDSRSIINSYGTKIGGATLYSRIHDLHQDIIALQKLSKDSGITLTLSLSPEKDLKGYKNALNLEIKNLTSIINDPENGMAVEVRRKYVKITDKMDAIKQKFSLIMNSNQIQQQQSINASSSAAESAVTENDSMKLIKSLAPSTKYDTLDKILGDPEGKGFKKDLASFRFFTYQEKIKFLLSASLQTLTGVGIIIGLIRILCGYTYTVFYNESNIFLLAVTARNSIMEQNTIQNSDTGTNNNDTGDEIGLSASQGADDLASSSPDTSNILPEQSAFDSPPAQDPPIETSNGTGNITHRDAQESGTSRGNNTNNPYVTPSPLRRNDSAENSQQPGLRKTVSDLIKKNEDYDDISFDKNTGRVTVECTEEQGLFNFFTPRQHTMTFSIDDTRENIYKSINQSPIKNFSDKRTMRFLNSIKDQTKPQNSGENTIPAEGRKRVKLQ